MAKVEAVSYGDSPGRGVMPLQEISITLAAAGVIAASAVFAALSIFQRARGDVTAITDKARTDYVGLLEARVAFLEAEVLRLRNDAAQWERERLQWNRRELELLRIAAKVDAIEKKQNGMT